MLTIERNLRRILLIAIGIVALLMTATFFLLEYASYRQHIVGNYQTLSTTLGINLAPHLVLFQSAPARDILTTIESERAVEAAFLFDRFDRPLTYYKRAQARLEKNPPENVLNQGEIAETLATGRQESRFHSAHMTLFTPIYDNGEKLGTLYLVISLRAFYERILGWMAAALTVTIVAIPLGVALAARLTRRITDPLAQLAQQMAGIASRQDFSVRATLPAFNELRTLAVSFNTMLEQVELRDHSLAAINANLEVMVLQATQDLRESDIKYRALFENSPTSLWEADFSGLLKHLRQLKQKNISDFHGHFHHFPTEFQDCLAEVRVNSVNHRTLELFAFADKDQLQQGLRTLDKPLAQELLLAACQAVAEERISFRGEGLGLAADGRELYLSLHWAVLPDHEHDFSKVVIAVEDLTARKSIEQELLTSLQEKEILVREVHHRVKNNLQVISSLIRLQLKRFTDPASIAEMQTTLNRIRSIALVHEKLYHYGHQITDLSDFMSDLAQELRRIYQREESPIEITVEIDKLGAQLPFDLVTSLIMILNELLTNAFKYAFTNQPGRVEIALRQEGNRIILSVDDNGGGLPSSSRVPGALGLTLVESLAAQNGGTVTYAGPPGTCITVSCPFPAASVKDIL